MIIAAWVLVFLLSFAGVVQLTSLPYNIMDIPTSMIWFTSAYFIFHAIQQGAY